MEDHQAQVYRRISAYDARFRSNEISLTLADWRYDTCLRLCPPRPQDAVLDIGCGDGEFLALARDCGMQAFGIDVDDRAVHLARNGRGLAEVRCGGWAGIRDFGPPGRFNLITSFDMIEHVSSPLAVGTAILEALKPGGQTCITVPRYDRSPRWFDVESDSPPHHFTLWTPAALRILLTRVGFVDIRVVEKPLMSVDLILHLRLGLARIVRNWRPSRGGSEERSTPDEAARAVRTNRWTAGRFISGVILLMLKPLDWALQTLRLGRGHTLLACARKPI
jgi:SAM-dependent methyltransferase